MLLLMPRLFRAADGFAPPRLCLMMPCRHATVFDDAVDTLRATASLRA